MTEQSLRRLHVVDTDSRSVRLRTQTMNHSRQAGAEHLWQQVLHQGAGEKIGLKS